MPKQDISDELIDHELRDTQKGMKRGRVSQSSNKYTYYVELPSLDDDKCVVEDVKLPALSTLYD